MAHFRAKEKGDPDFKAWEESMELREDHEKSDPAKTTKEIVDYFNSTLRPGESEREFVQFLRTEEIDEPEINFEDDFFEEDEDDY